MSDPAEKKTVDPSVVEDLIYLLACAVNSEVPDLGRVNGMDLAALCREAKRHMLASAVAFALASAGVQSGDFVLEQAKAVRKMAIMDSEQIQIINRFEEAGIWYMPLKGAVLKSLYPAFGMRQMSDRDILVDPARMADVRQIMEGLGFTTEEFGEHHHDCYVKPPVSNFEMHHHLFEGMQGKKITDYYANVTSRLLKDEGNAFGWHFSPEDFYLHMVVHEYKHHSGSGTGLRSLLDTYVYLKNTPLNMDYVAAETEKLGIAGFERENRILAQHLFSGVTLTAAEQRMLQRFVGSGTYGSEEHFAENQLAAKGRKGYFLSRLTLPYSVMQEHYPVLKKLPVLYPFCWAHRLVHGFLFKHDKFMHQLKIGLSRKDDQGSP